MLTQNKSKNTKFIRQNKPVIFLNNNKTFDEKINSYYCLS